MGAFAPRCHGRPLLLVIAVALLAAVPAGCHRAKSSAEPAEELSRALAEVERLREERRDLSLRARNLSRELHEAVKELEEARSGGPAAKADPEERAALLERIADLETRLAAAQSAAIPQDPGPGPEDMARLFLAAMRRGDERALDSLVDWNRLLETALLKTEGGGAATLDEFRDLSNKEKSEKVERVREEFLDFILGDSAPVLDGLPPIGSTTIVPVRIRAGEPVDHVWWEVLLERIGGVWKVTGLVRNEERAPAEEVPQNGTGAGEENR